MKKETYYERLQKYGRMWNENGIKQTAYEEGRQEGVKETEERWRLDKIETIHKLLNKETMSILEIATSVSVDEAYVLEIKKAMIEK